MDLLIMDDSISIRERIVELLSELEGIDKIYQTENPALAVKIMIEQQPDVVILDIQVPPAAGLRNGIDVLKVTKQQRPYAGVIMLTNFANPMYRLECERLGADYFFDKSSEFDQVTAAVMEIMSRQSNGLGPAGHLAG